MSNMNCSIPHHVKVSPRGPKTAEERQTTRIDQASVSNPCDCFVSLIIPTPSAKRNDILINNPLTVHRLSVRQVHVKPGRRKQKVIFYTCLTLTPTMTLSSVP